MFVLSPGLSDHGSYVHGMDVSPGRVLAVALSVFVFLFGLVYVQYGPVWGYQAGRFTFVVLGALGMYLLLAWWLNWQRRIAAAAVLLGVIVFHVGVYGDGVGCNAVRYAGAEYGITYVWETNRLLFGDHFGMNYRCSTRPYRWAVLLGYLLTTGGMVGLLSDRDDGEGLVRALVDRVR